MQIEHVSIDNLIPYARNTRTHSDEQVAQIAASITEFGFTNPVLIDGDGGIIAGHGRVMAAKSLQLAEVPCVRLGHLTEVQRRAYIIADNKLALNAGWDEDLLRSELAELKDLSFDLGLIGFDSKDLEELFYVPLSEDGLTDPDNIPDPPAEPITQVGDLWQLGNHRLLCGDSTSTNAMQTLLGGGYADMVFTDPPYNVAYTGGTKDKLTIKNDSMKSEDFYRFLHNCFVAVSEVCTPGTPIYICHADTEGLNFRRALIDAGWLVKNCIIWVKNQLCLGRMDHQMRHEPILYGWKSGGPHRWYGGRKVDSIIEETPGLSIAAVDNGFDVTFSDGVRFCSLRVPSYEVVTACYDDETSIWKTDKPQKNPDHPTTKPVDISKRAIRNSSLPGGNVLDCFLGSGSTLIACKQLGRVCYGMELDPIYCDVIVKRWEQFTGRKAERIS